MKLPRRVAAVLLNSLKGGVVPRIGLPYIAVGRKAEIEALLASAQTQDYYSDRYACAYLTADDADTAVWYLDGEAARERVRMAALFGVDQLCLSDLSSVADYENYSLLEGLD